MKIEFLEIPNPEEFPETFVDNLNENMDRVAAAFERVCFRDINETMAADLLFAAQSLKVMNGTLVLSEGIPDPDLVLPGASVLSGDLNEGPEALLTWTAATPGTNPLSHYVLFRSADGGEYENWAQVTEGDPLTYTDEEIDENVVYRYYVIAVDDEDNEGPQSNIVELVESQSVFPLSEWQNPGAEDGTTGWTTTTGVFTSSTGREPPSGTHSFAPGSSALSIQYQRIDLDANGVPTAEIDADNTRIRCTWWGSSFDQNHVNGNDQPQLHFVFRDAALVEISTYSSGFKDPTTPSSPTGVWFWDQYEDQSPIPALTRYIDVTCEAQRSSVPGNIVNNAAFDDIFPVVELIVP